MKRTLTSAFLLFSFLILFCRIVNCAEDNEKTQSSQKTQQTLLKPILPPMVPGPLPGVSPTPSPNISAPPIMPNTINTQKINTDTQLRKPQASIPMLPNLPKLPTLPPSTSVAKSVPSAPMLQPKIQLIKSLLGTVINIGSEKDEILWLDVKDRFSGETVRINVNSKKTRVIKKDALPLALKDIKVGDMVRVIFNQAGKKIPVNVISIISEEDLKPNTQPK